MARKKKKKKKKSAARKAGGRSTRSRATSVKKQETQYSTFENEYTLEGPYEFEGFTTPNETIEDLYESLGVQALRGQSGVGVVREGENAYGTWGYLITWDGAKWVHQGYTLEPRSSVGKGPIPLGDFRFNRWMSSKLKKTLRLHNVPGFTDILIHVGNTQSETKGCILAAKNVDRLKNPTRLVNSRVMTDWLYDNQPQGLVLVRSR